MSGIAGIIFIVCCVHGGGMIASLLPHGSSPGNSFGVASLWELHTLAKMLSWIGKVDPAVATQLGDLSKKLDQMQTDDAKKIDTLVAENAALAAALKAANITVPVVK